MSENSSSGSDPAMLSGRYAIQMDKPMPHLDSPFAKAYAVTDKRAASRTMFGLVCRPDGAPRIEVISQFARLRRMPVLTAVDAGTISVSDTEGRRYIIVFEAPAGERVFASLDSKISPLREDEVVRYIIRPLMLALKEMSSRFIPHRSIRADNIYYTDSSRKAVILGECVSCPPGMSQPVMYEPIDAGMAMPSGRGSGAVSDDLYAFGVMLVVLLAGCNPVADMDDRDLLESKIANGSYSTLVGQMRVSLSIMEPLRGLLCDKVAERWQVNDIELWLEGRQLSPKQPMLPTRASRAISFAGRDYWNRFSLSYAMGQNWRDVGQIFKNRELEGWIRNSYSDDETAEVIGAAGGGESANPEHAVCQVLTVLQSQLPIRLREFSARIDGVVQCFAAEYQNPEMRKTFIELMNVKLPQMYLQMTPGNRTEQASLLKIFDMIKYFIDRPQIGFGPERALYESNRRWPCQSPLIQQDYVCEADELLPALDRLARRGPSGDPMDRHIAAFCAARLSNMPERALRMLSIRDDIATYRLATLQILADVQRTAGGRQTFPALSQWIGKLLEPVIQKFHNRAYRDKLGAEIERAADNGDLLELQFLIDNHDAQSQDDDGYSKAKAEYANLAQAITWLEEGGLTSPSRVAEKGQQSATVISALVSGLLIVALSIVYVI